MMDAVVAVSEIFDVAVCNEIDAVMMTTRMMFATMMFDYY